MNGGVAVWDWMKTEAELRQQTGDDGEYYEWNKNRAPVESGALRRARVRER